MATKTSLLFLLSLLVLVFLVVAKQDPELKQCKHQCEQQQQYDEREKRTCKRQCEDYYREKHGGGGGGGDVNIKEEEEEESGDPYVFNEQHFRTMARSQEGRIGVLQRFSERSELLKGIDNYRLAILEANPHTFLLPNHKDAELIFFVMKGRGAVSLVRHDNRESFNIRRGDIVRVPAGTVCYLINRDSSQKLQIAGLFQPVAVPGRFEQFYGPGGEDPESFYRAFSTEILEAALNVRRDKLERLFGQQNQGAFIKASEEQIRAMSHQEEEGGVWPFKSESKGFNLFNKRASQSNDYGQLFEATFNDYKQLRDMNVAVSFANITKGSMHTLLYNSHATKISLVVEGTGYFEMACPHKASSGGSGHQGGGREGSSQTGVSYQKVSAQLRPGKGFVVPAGHPYVTVASKDQNLQVICFEINAENNEKIPLAGKRNIIKQFEKEAKELSFNVAAREVDEAFGKQNEEFFFKGPRQQHEGRAYE